VKQEWKPEGKKARENLVMEESLMRGLKVAAHKARCSRGAFLRRSIVKNGVKPLTESEYNRAMGILPTVTPLADESGGVDE
jgi:hypothetical protein